MAQKGGGAASDCARVLVYDTAKRRMQHVFTVLFSVCPMPQLQPQLSLPALHARIVIEAFSHFIRLCCRLEDPAHRPSLHWGGQQTPPPTLPPPFGILLPWPGRDLCAYAKHTVCLKTRGGKRVRPFLRVGSSFFCFARHAKGCSSYCSPFPISFSPPALLYCLAVQVFACFGIFPTRFCLFSKLKLI